MVWSDESRKIVLNRSITALQLLKAFAFSSHRQTREWSNRVHTPEQLGQLLYNSTVPKRRNLFRLTQPICDRSRMQSGR